MERDMESLEVEMETPKELHEVGKQTLAREVFEKEAEKRAPERDCEPGRLEVNIPKVILEGGAQRGSEREPGPERAGLQFNTGP